MTALVDIFNMALSTSGARQFLSSPTDGYEAEVCNTWYPTVRDWVLRAAHWPSARAFSRLALQVERDVDVAWVGTDPAPGWRFAYSHPSDMVAPRHFADFARFEIGNVNGSAAIMSQTEAAILVYTTRQENIDAWEIGLRMGIIHALAAHITRPLSGKRDLAVDNLEKSNGYILQARLDAANSQEVQFESLPDWIIARGYGNTTPSTRYVFPMGPLFSVTEGVGLT